VIKHLNRTTRELFQYREVLANILSQHLKVKYKRTSLGYVWSLLNPVLQLLVLTAVFSHVVRLGMRDYTLYLFSGLLAWTFFSNTLSTASVSLLENENFIKKVYLPKVIFPLSRMLLCGIDFLFSLAALSLIALALGFKFYLSVVLLPLVMLNFAAFTLGCALIVSVATVFFRDIQYLLGVFLNLLYFLTPIIYPMSALPQNYQKWMNLNPMGVQINLFHKVLYYGEMPTPMEWLPAIAMSVVLLLGGLAILMSFEDEVVFRM